jgi:hypothetical protein
LKSVLYLRSVLYLEFMALRNTVNLNISGPKTQKIPNFHPIIWVLADHAAIANNLTSYIHHPLFLCYKVYPKINRPMGYKVCSCQIMCSDIPIQKVSKSKDVDTRNQVTERFNLKQFIIRSPKCKCKIILFSLTLMGGQSFTDHSSHCAWDSSVISLSDMQCRHPGETYMQYCNLVGHALFLSFANLWVYGFYILALGSIVLSKLQDGGHLHVCIFLEYQFSFPTQLAYRWSINTSSFHWEALELKMGTPTDERIAFSDITNIHTPGTCINTYRVAT